MASWEKTASSFLHLFRLDKVKHKILVFALLATLIPSLTLAWLSYVHNERSLTEKTTEELRNVSSHASREIDLWLKERFYDARIFSNSYEVSENLDMILRGRRAPTRGVQAPRRLKDYLSSVQEKFIDYEELLVLGPNGRVIASSADSAGPVNLPPDWLSQVEGDEQVVGQVYWDESTRRAARLIAVPIKAADGRFLGALTAKLSFFTIKETLRNLPLGETGHVYLITPEGRLVVSSRIGSPALTDLRLAAHTVQALLAREASSLGYADYQGTGVVGILQRVPQSDWAVVAEIGRDEAYAQIVRLRNQTALMVSGLLVSIGLIAYLLGLTIVRPLNRLTAGAKKVADGDLDVDLPVVTRGEVGYMTRVFNRMVARLRRSREQLAAANLSLSEKNEELARLSVTDALTGLYNRRYLTETLANEVARAQRHEHAFAVLMIDIDHFKKVNDRYGHLMGDDVLIGIASSLARSVREVDYAARYGGEEFLLLLPETGLDGAVKTAERIRVQLAGEKYAAGKDKVTVTVSVGVAGYPSHGDTPESIIASADAALYQAKRRGRNRVVRARQVRRKATFGTPASKRRKQA
ncbi:MAG: diguanylate cyclase [Gemmatimonadales bacterium]|nr:diguanylate cyclase [Gemmatimonadales bacterium]NIN12272.1 diguanylate cyclase [Gemmatimonadales bacterium]NIN50735.1 diguanylate cyclase [Gemmatimonadales bacterium]NIP08199.1 diguanylate cyclase [Gemmatimonadales bacterium]NIR03477.1 diguanylate cyclase [Gemmatimonadales bacterium]